MGITIILILLTKTFEIILIVVSEKIIVKP